MGGFARSIRGGFHDRLRERGVGMHRHVNVAHGQLGGFPQHQLGDQLGSLGSDDVGSE